MFNRANDSTNCHEIESNSTSWRSILDLNLVIAESKTRKTELILVPNNFIAGLRHTDSLFRIV